MSLANDLIARADGATSPSGSSACGYVGLPLAVELGRAGFKVIGYDISEKVVRGPQRRAVAHQGHHRRRGRRAARRTAASRRPPTPRRLGEADAISICVPTPLSKYKDPDVSLHRRGHRGDQGDAAVAARSIILESTTYPGTTREIMLPALESTGPQGRRGLLPRLLPERVDPGNPTYGTRRTRRRSSAASRADCHRGRLRAVRPGDRHARPGVAPPRRPSS